MNVFTPLSILIISMFIVASMKLIPGVFALFYHNASGKYSKKSADLLTIFFIFGAETLPAIIFVALNFIFNIFSFTDLNITSMITIWTTTGLLIALGLAFLFFYFRRGRGTKLFIPRSLAKNYIKKAELVKNNSDAFMLGIISGIPELLFTFPLYLLVFVETSRSFVFTFPCALLIFLFILVSTIPILFLCFYFKKGNNLADYIRLRQKNKPFFRIFIPILYFLLAILLIVFEVIL